MTGRLADFIYRWRFLLSALILLGALWSLPRANITDIDNDITSWFSREDPAFQDYERFREEFGGTRTLIVALEADAPERLFSRATLQFISEITGDIERVDTVQRVTSLATATVVQSLPDGGLDVRPLLERLDATGAEEIRRRALEDDLIRGDLVSEDATVTAVVVSFDEDRIDEVRAGVIQQIHEIVDPKLPPGVRAYYNGSLEISETYNRITLDNLRKFTPPIFLFTVVALYALFRSWRKTAVSVVAIGVSVLCTLGLYSLMGFTFNVLSSMIVPLVVVLAIADDVHIMQHWDEERRIGDAEFAFKATIRNMTAPLFGASVTTALGMLSLATSEVVAVKSFGVGSAAGIMVDFVISLVLVPTMLSLVKHEEMVAPHELYLVGPLRRAARVSTTYPGRVVVVSLVLGIVAALGMMRLRVDTNHINFFAKSHPISESATVIDRHLSGVYSYEIMLEGPPDSLKTPDALQRMDRLQEQIRAFPNVKKVTSIADYVKRINRELNDGRPEASVIPADPNTIAQELFVFALGGEGRHELERMAASDYSRAQIAVKLQSMSSELVLDEVESADRLAQAAFAGTGISVMTTGSGRLFSTLDRYLVDSQLSSFGTAFLTVFGVIFIVFRSFRFGLLAIVPNLLPVLAVLGFMGYLDISLNIATVMVASVALGVVDDDTIHFINRYRRETAGGATTNEAIFTATEHEGRASLTTAIVNSCGYGVLLLSEYKPTAWFGGLLALTMAVAFLAEVFILPAMIKLLPRFFGSGADRHAGPVHSTEDVATSPATHPAIPEQMPRRRLPTPPNTWRPASPRCAPVILLSAAVLLWPSPALAQVTSGHVSVLGDYMPNRRDTAELRTRVFAQAEIDPSPKLLIVVSGFAEGLLARRPEGPVLEPGFVGDAVAAVHEATAEWTGTRYAMAAGFGRVVWGRLDELQPTDVVNPIDVSKFFFEGRNEARLPVALVRGRVFLSGRTWLEALYVPAFRRGRFDRLDEPTSPFNIAAAVARDPVVCLAIGCPTLPIAVDDREPGLSFGNAQGGARFSTTMGRVDWSVSAFRGFEPFGLYRIEPGSGSPQVCEELAALGLSCPERRAASLALEYPRFTMAGGDFETVRGQWGVRGEIAALVEDNFQDPTLQVARGHSVDAGIGVDRRAAGLQLSGTVLLHRQWADGSATPSIDRTDVTLIVSADRSFRAERHRLRLFGVANPSEGSGFARAIATTSLRDNLALELSTGWFIGNGDDTIGRFADSDFVYSRVKWYF